MFQGPKGDPLKSNKELAEKVQNSSDVFSSLCYQAWPKAPTLIQKKHFKMPNWQEATSWQFPKSGGLLNKNSCGGQSTSSLPETKKKKQWPTHQSDTKTPNIWSNVIASLSWRHGINSFWLKGKKNNVRNIIRGCVVIHCYPSIKLQRERQTTFGIELQ